MSNENDKTSNPSEQAASSAVLASGSSKSIWDNDLPPGDSPPMPRWPLTLAIVLYAGWMVFLVSMMVLRLMTS